MGGGRIDTRVHESKDAGVSWSELEGTVGDHLRGVTIDSAPSDPSRFYISAVTVDRGLSPDGIFADPANCLTWTRTGLYACTNRLYSGGSELGFATDAGFSLSEPAPFEPLLEPTELDGAPSVRKGPRPAWSARSSAGGRSAPRSA